MVFRKHTDEKAGRTVGHFSLNVFCMVGCCLRTVLCMNLESAHGRISASVLLEV